MAHRMATNLGTVLSSVELVRRVVFTEHTTPLKNILLGAGLAYALSEQKYIHLPAVFVCPSIYAGYQCYMNRDRITSYLE
jgi:hypothetical protein